MNKEKNKGYKNIFIILLGCLIFLFSMYSVNANNISLVNDATYIRSNIFSGGVFNTQTDIYADEGSTVYWRGYFKIDSNTYTYDNLYLELVTYSNTVVPIDEPVYFYYCSNGFSETTIHWNNQNTVNCSTESFYNISNMNGVNNIKIDITQFANLDSDGIFSIMMKTNEILPDTGLFRVYSDDSSINKPFLNFSIISCFEDWIVNYTECNINDERIKYYTDNNSCGTFNNLPLDNGTIESCDYCNETWINYTSSCNIYGNRVLSYYDSNNCNTIFGLPIDNGTIIETGCNYSIINCYDFEDLTIENKITESPYDFILHDTEHNSITSTSKNGDYGVYTNGQYIGAYNSFETGTIQYPLTYSSWYFEKSYLYPNSMFNLFFDSNNGIMLVEQSDRKLRLYTKVNGINNYVETLNPIVTRENEWDLYTIRLVSPTERHVYRNGIKILTSNTELNFVSSNPTIYMGVGSTYRFHGNIDDVTLFNQDISEEDILAMYYDSFSCSKTNTYTCIEDWQTFYTECSMLDTTIKYYVDNNNCGTIFNLPLDNGTTESCNYCNETWIEQYTPCNINDEIIKYYIDTNDCGTPFGLPIDNGTIEICNYCDEGLEFIETTCSPLGFIDSYYVDNNYNSCCLLTNLSSDCSINFEPYNITNQTECNYNIGTGLNDINITFKKSMLFFASIIVLLIIGFLVFRTKNIILLLLFFVTGLFILYSIFDILNYLGLNIMFLYPFFMIGWIVLVINLVTKINEK